MSFGLADAVVVVDEGADSAHDILRRDRVELVPLHKGRLIIDLLHDCDFHWSWPLSQPEV